LDTPKNDQDLTCAKNTPS